MIKSIGLKGEFIIKEMNFEIEKGSKNVFIFEKKEQGKEFLNLIIGMKNPEKGEIFLMGQSLKEITRDKLFELRKKIAVVFESGGLISNLKAWENLILPALYHKIDKEENIFKKGLELLKKLDFKKEPMSPIAELTQFERRIIGIARAFLINPEIIIFEFLFDGLGELDRNSLFEKIKALTDKTTIIYILGSEKESLLIEKANIINYAEN